MALLSLFSSEITAQSDILEQLQMESLSLNREIVILNEKEALEAFVIYPQQNINTTDGNVFQSWSGQSLNNSNRHLYIATSRETISVNIVDGSNHYTLSKANNTGRWTNQSPTVIANAQCQLHGSPSQKKVNHKSTSQQDILIYKLALTSTPEFSVLHGNTIPDVTLALLNYINQVNAIYERELGIRLELIDDIEKLIYLDGQEDPFSDQVGLAVNQNIDILSDSIGIDNYDIGHLLRSGGGGLANLEVACTASKGFGVSGFSDASTFALLLAHEIGHQLGAGHTWNSCSTSLNQSQRSPSSAMEPGSGNTIMSYAGLCGNNNVTTTREDYFHTISIDQIRTYTRTGAGQSCAQTITGSNTPPTITAVLPTEKSIPRATPFILSGYAVDMENDPLTYAWDQIDQGDPTNLGDQTPYNPIIRSKSPTTANHRYIPTMNDLANDVINPAELLPNIDRSLEFRFLVRDNNPTNGQLSGANFSLVVDPEAGPFMIEDQSLNVWHAMGTHPVSWDVSNTDNATVDCQVVNILIDYDGSLTFQDTLAHQVPNDGLHYVHILDTISTTARLMIKAADNIFFDISAPFEIKRSTTPDFQIYSDTTEISICDSVIVQYPIHSVAQNGFINAIRYSAPSLPTGLTATFTNNDMPPAAEVTAQIMVSADAERISHLIEIDAFSPNGTNQRIPFVLELQKTTLIDPVLEQPESGSVSPSSDHLFEWSDDPKSEVNVIEVSSNPTFDPENLVLTDSTSLDEISQAITSTGVYFWRILSKNDCGALAYSTTNVFGIKSNTCSDYSNTDNHTISNGIDSVSSTITAAQDIPIQSISLSNIRGTHSYIGDLTFVLESPNGNRYQLLSQECNEGKDFDFGINPNGDRLRCNINRGIVYKPSDSFSTLVGTSAAGDWTLKVIDNIPGDGGTLTGWELNICTYDNPGHPELITADTLKLAPNDVGMIGNNILSHTDSDNPSSEVRYIITGEVANGHIILVGDTLRLGDSFTQADIDNGALAFHHDNIIEESDQLTYVVTDSQGYVSAPKKLSITISNDVGSPTLQESLGITVFPNPANQRLYINATEEHQSPLQARLYHINGRLVAQQVFLSSGSSNYIDVSKHPEGVYVLSLVTGTDSGSQRVILQR